VSGGVGASLDEHLDAQTWFYTQGDERNRVAGKPPVAPGVPRFLGGKPIKVTGIELPQTSWYPSLLPSTAKPCIASRAAVVAAETSFQEFIARSGGSVQAAAGCRYGHAGREGA